MSALTAAEIESAAADLRAAERDRRQIGLLSIRHPAMTMDDAYAVQRALTARKLAAGGRRVGWKIGLTSKAMQAALEIDIPDSGMLLDDMLFPDGALIPAGRFIEPRAEAEIAFVMRRDLAGGASRDEVLSATDYVAPALEILDTRILRRDPESGRARNIMDAVADNAANAGVVLGGARNSPAEFDLRRAGAIVFRNGEVEETGLGAGVLNDPALAVAWLAARMKQSGGETIRAGDIVLSGSFIRPMECPPGSKIEADFGGFGFVSCEFASAGKTDA